MAICAANVACNDGDRTTENSAKSFLALRESWYFACLIPISIPCLDGTQKPNLGKTCPVGRQPFAGCAFFAEDLWTEEAKTSGE